jgi:hypothetical protein
MIFVIKLLHVLLLIGKVGEEEIDRLLVQCSYF